MDGEKVLAHCGTKYWIWVCTDSRLLRYRSGSGGAEELHDLSFDEISSISFVNTGRNDKLGGYGILSLLVGIILTFIGIAGGELLLLILGVLLFVIGGYFIYLWLNSEKSFFEFKGSGMLRDDDEWRIDEASADDTAEVQAFVRTVRSQL